MKLKCIHVGSIAIYDKDCETSQTNKLESLSRIWIGEPYDEVMLKSSPHLLKLKLSTCRCVDLSFLTQLESLNIRFHNSNGEGISFPSNIKQLSLCGFESKFDWEIMSTIGRLGNLEVLKVNCFSFTGNTWYTIEGEFQKLEFLKLDGILDLTYWDVFPLDNFPRLKRLILRNCCNLQELPSEIGGIPSLEMIEVQGLCQESLLESAIRIQEEQLDLGNEEIRIIVTDAYW